jgi:hypothetical protein
LRGGVSPKTYLTLKFYATNAWLPPPATIYHLPPTTIHRLPLHHTTTSTAHQVQRAFSYFDQDGNGRITLEDLERGCVRLGIAIKDAECDVIMNMCAEHEPVSVVCAGDCEVHRSVKFY